MVSPQQAMIMQQQGMGMAQGMAQGMGQGMAQGMAMPQRGPSFPNQGPLAGGVLQGPLAFLEKTTSNIGMPDGRR